jgi:hypothetical protein
MAEGRLRLSGRAGLSRFGFHMFTSTATQKGGRPYNLDDLPHEIGIIVKPHCNCPKIEPGYFQLVSCPY